ncbi:MAG: chromosome segregation SMC family protein, partial [Mycobacteriales bacterium]
MFLKSLTLRGFKSFASATTLHLEPGITAVVGPNGSGKSNVVDAIAWVLGEQGAKSLRGGKMEDVIFAGTAGRPALGRAEVVLTIDNSDGALPLDYAEITISRLMYRSGESEYAINGTPCRLLDVQELLSDSGIGREMHVIVGQGQLDAVLSGRAEDRRAFIEEAAGVLKHRKRKEKALRKLEAMGANLARLTDLTAELRRQLGPLGRQAEVARRAATVQADLRDARLRLAADELVTLRAELTRELADEASVRAQRAAAEEALATASAREQRLEAELAAVAPQLTRAQETWYRLSTLAERLRATGSLAAERTRALVAAEEQVAAGPNPEELEGAAQAVRSEERELTATLTELVAELSERTRERELAERRLEAAEAALLQAARLAADRREGLARLSGQVAALRSRAAAAEEEIGRLAAAVAQAGERARTAAAEYTELESQIAGLDAGEVGLDARHEAALAELEAADSRLAALREQERAAERDRSALQARREALALSLDRRDAGASLLAAGGTAGVRGTLAELLRVRPGFEAAVAAALGPIADALAARDVDAALAAVERARAEKAGRLTLVVGEAGVGEAGVGDAGVGDAGVGVGEPTALAGAGPAPFGQWLAEVVAAPAGFDPVLHRLLSGHVVVDDLDRARHLVSVHPELVAVTRDGEVFAAGWVVGGSAGAPSRLEVQAALEETDAALEELVHHAERLRFAL